MVMSCSVIGCKNRKDKINGSKFSFFRFPRDEVMKRKWVVAIGREHVGHGKKWIHGNWTPQEHNAVCSDHFRKEDFDTTYYGNKFNRLYPGVVPTLKLGLDLEETQDGSDEEPAPSQRGRKSRCAALGCDYEGEPDEDSAGVTLHHFPTTHSMFVRWRNAIGIKNTELLKSPYICSSHFKEEDFFEDEDGYVKLSRTAVPTKFELPPLDLLYQVEPSAPYLQPQVVLSRCDGGAGSDISMAPQDEEAEFDAIDENSTMVITQDHTYNRDLEQHVEQMEQIVEEFKMEVLSACQKVKSLKISVNALKSLYLKEVEALQFCEGEPPKASQINAFITPSVLQINEGETPIALQLQLNEGENPINSQLYGGLHPIASHINDGVNPVALHINESINPLALHFNESINPLASQIDEGETSIDWQLNEGETRKPLQLNGGENPLAFQPNEPVNPIAFQLNEHENPIALQMQLNEGEIPSTL